MKYPLTIVDSGNVSSEQAETSNANPKAGSVDMRILIELQLISMMLYQEGRFSEDLGKMRQDIAQSIT